MEDCVYDSSFLITGLFTVFVSSTLLICSDIFYKSPSTMELVEEVLLIPSSEAEASLYNNECSFYINFLAEAVDLFQKIDGSGIILPLLLTCGFYSEFMDKIRNDFRGRTGRARVSLESYMENNHYVL
jgi:hypothetical protein